MRRKPRPSKSEHQEELLDEALEETFPASDTPALVGLAEGSPGRMRRRRNRGQLRNARRPASRSGADIVGAFNLRPIASAGSRPHFRRCASARPRRQTLGPSSSLPARLRHMARAVFPGPVELAVSIHVMIGDDRVAARRDAFECRLHESGRGLNLTCRRDKSRGSAPCRRGRCSPFRRWFRRSRR